MAIKIQRLLRTAVAAAAIAALVPSVAMAKKQPAPDTAQPKPDETKPADTAPAADAPKADDSKPADGAPAADAPPAPPPPAPAPTEAAAPAPGAGATVTAEAPTETEAAANVQQDDEGEVIIITGSTIARKHLTTPAPVSILDRADLDAAGMVSIGEVLQNLPSQSNAINVQFNNGGDGSTRISLRGLGAGRTLVLLNGRRHVAGGTGANASVDLNAIPMAVIQRVEVLKDGASAIYGSDAIGGVVNLITRKDFEGTEGAIYTGTTQGGGGTIYDVSVVTGINSKKGNVVFSAGYYEQRKIMAGQRGFSKSDKSYDWDCKAAKMADPNYNCVATNGSTATPAGTIIDQTGAAGNPDWDAIINADNPDPMERLGVYYNDPNGGWRNFALSGNSDVGEGDFYNYQPENYLLTPQKRYNVYSAGHYDFKDKKVLRGFYEASYMRRSSSQLLAPTPLFTISEGITTTADNAYNPFGRDFTDIRRRMVEAGNRRFFQDINTFRIVTGLEGEIPDDAPILKGWRWNAYYNFGRTSGTDVNAGRFVRSRVVEALGSSYIDGDGVAQCGTPTNPGSGNCVPLNLFGGAGSVTDEMINFITYTGVAQGFTQQKTLNANLSGKLVDTPWGGDVHLAVGAEYRREDGAFTPDPITASGDTTGNKQEPTGGGFDVSAGYAELSIVPVVGKPLAKWLEFTAAARAVDYSSFGSNLSWKLGGLWRMPAGVSARGTYSTAFRAPSIGQLFAGTADSFPNVSDPCDTTDGPLPANVAAKCAADGVSATHTDVRDQLRSLVGGNPNTQPETAKIATAGIVIEPEAVKGLAFTFDYWWVNVDDAIQPLGASLLLSNCYGNNTSASTDCDRIIRNSSGLITTILDTTGNAGGNKTAGLDFAVSYRTETASAGTFRYNFEGTWLQKYNFRDPSGRLIKGKNVYDLGVFPSWRANFSTLWMKDDYGAGFNARYIGNFRECEDDDCSVPEPLDRDVAANITADVFVSYTKKSDIGTSRLTVGVNNVTDQDPSIIYNGFLGTSDASTYDYLGRYFYMRFQQMF